MDIHNFCFQCLYTWPTIYLCLCKFTNWLVFTEFNWKCNFKKVILVIKLNLATEQSCLFLLWQKLIKLKTALFIWDFFYYWFWAKRLLLFVKNPIQEVFRDFWFQRVIMKCGDHEFSGLLSWKFDVFLTLVQLCAY